MKKAIYSLLALMIVASCGTVSKLVNEESLGTHVQKSPAQIYAEDADADNIRAWASYNGFESQNLENYAATAARAKLGDEIATLVSNAVEMYENGARIESKPVEGNIESASMSESLVNSKIKAVSKELISGSRVVMSDRYRQSDGTVTCFTAVEISVKGIINNIKGKTSVQEAISEGRKAAIDFESKLFEESMKASFEDLKKAKGE